MPPILFMIFNRPEKTRAVFETIRAAKPARLYVAADGPRAGNANDQEKCAPTRAVVDMVDWDCQVHKLYREENLGCRRAVSEAITWFFENEPEGIILEDDIITDPGFFQFAGEMLERYRDDERVMSITACNFLPADHEYEASYYFSAFNHVWGWASWRRAWDFYDRELADLDTRQTRKMIGDVCSVPGFADYWLQRFRKVRDGKIDTWDYSWLYTQWKHGGLTVTGSVNMVHNIGFDEEATHTAKPDSPLAELVANSIPTPLVHPERIAQHKDADHRVAVDHFRIKALSWRKNLRRKLRMSVIRHLWTNGSPN